MIKNKTVLLLKTQKSDGSSDKYEELITSNGFEVRQVKTLVFDFKNIEALKDKLKKNDEYEGILLSSPRCVHAIYLAVANDETLINTWRTKNNFAVGEATHIEALEKLQLDSKGQEAGNAINLSKIILENKHSYKRPFLFPHGNLKTDTLNIQLGKEGISVDGIMVYDTITNPNIKTEIADISDDFTTIPEYVVFFSPSGFRSSINLLKKIPVDINKLKLIAIGPVTEAAIKAENLQVWGVSENPTPKDVLNLILNH